MKKIFFGTIGTTGDVLPFALLAKELQSRETSVSTSSFSHHEDLFSKVGVPFLPEPTHYQDGEISKIFDKIFSQKSLLAEVNVMMEAMVFHGLEDRFCHRLETLQGHDLAIAHVADHATQAAAIELGIPYLILRFETMSLETKDYTMPPNQRNFGSFINRLSWKFGEAFLSRFDRKLNERLKSSGYSKAEELKVIRQKSPLLNLCACSKHLATEYSDFPDNFKLVGQISKESANVQLNSADKSLQDYINKHRGHFAFSSLGSMGGESRSKANALTAKVFNDLKLPLLLQLGDTEDLSAEEKGEFVTTCRFVDHSLIFSECKYVIHHAGSGTTHSVSGAGLPSIAIPHILDQQYFSNLLKIHGASPGYVGIQKLTLARLRALVEKMNSGFESYSKEAKQLAQKLGQENGLKSSAKLVNDLLRAH